MEEIQEGQGLSVHLWKVHSKCHSERSEESHSITTTRCFATLNMTKVLLIIYSR
jgi:hypothetical protein